MSESGTATPDHSDASPAVSVVMPVYNALPHLDEAVESILGQTFTDFEFIILDDGSTDGSRERLREWAKRDKRIRLIEAKKNLGPVGSSNKVARAAKAPFVARMDADDISHPDRLKEQFELLRDNPDVGIVAVMSDMIDDSGKKIRDVDIWRLTRRSAFVPFAHGAMMYRRDVFDKTGGSRAECEYWEDLDLVVRMAEIAKVIVITKSLFSVRHSSTRTRVICDQEPLERALDTVYEATDQFRSSKNYREAVERRVKNDPKLDPRVFIALVSVHLWAGGNPRLFRHLLRRAHLSINMNSALALVWTAWASASPMSLRAFLTLVLKARNRLAGVKLSRHNAVFWRPLERPTIVKDIRRTA